MVQSRPQSQEKNRESQEKKRVLKAHAGRKSREDLAGKVFGKTVRVEIVEADRYRRRVGRINLGDRFVNAEMVRDGFAWRYGHYDKPGKFTVAEREAKAKGRGLWADKNPIPPWEWRRSRRRSSGCVRTGDRSLGRFSAFRVRGRGAGPDDCAAAAHEQATAPDPHLKHMNRLRRADARRPAAGPLGAADGAQRGTGLPAAVQSRLQSARAGVRQVQVAPAKPSGANQGRPVAAVRSVRTTSVTAGTRYTDP